MVNYSKKTLDKKEEQIKQKYLPLRFKEDIKINTLKDLLNQLFNNNLTNATYLLNGKLDYPNGRGRSYYDAYRLCMNYFPQLTFSEMYTTLRNYVKLNNPEFKNVWQYGQQPKAMFWTCRHIGKARFEGKLIFE